MENTDKNEEYAMTDLEGLKIEVIKEEPPDNPDFDLQTTHSINELGNIDTINGEIVTYFEKRIDEDELSNSDLEQAPCDENHEHNYAFTCEICKKGFRTYRSLLVHSSIHMQTEFANLSICTICHKKFEPRKLTYHFRTHNVKQTYQCYCCNYSCFTQSHLDEHVLRCHAPYTCNKCNISFKTELELKHHYKCHADEFPYACSICDQTFSTIANLSLHIRTFHKKRKYETFR